MATLVTLSQLELAVDPLVVTDDFTALSNRAVSRLYSKAATPGYMVEVFVGGSVASIVAPAGPTIQPVEGSYVVVPLEDYDHIAKFRWLNESGALPSCRGLTGVFRDVIPVDAKFSAAGYDHRAFVDHGDINSSGDRYYEIPFDLLDEDLSTLTALARKTYVPVVINSDTFPFSNLDVLKLAVLATVYEEENDVERASSYWNEALRELESDSQRFRGPQVINITYYDPASAEVTTTIN